MDPRPLLPFVFLLRSPACVFPLFSQQLLKLRRWWRSWPAGNWPVRNLFWFWVFIVCRDKVNGRANTRLCVLLFSCSLCLSVYYFFLWIYALFFLCSFLRFLVFCLGLASVFSSPAFFIFYHSWLLLCLPCLFFFWFCDPLSMVFSLFFSVQFPSVFPQFFPPFSPLVTFPSLAFIAREQFVSSNHWLQVYW